MKKTYTFLGDDFVGDYVVSCLDQAGYEFVEEIEKARYIFSYYLFPQETDEAYFSEEGIFPFIQPGSHLINLSTLGISVIETAAQMAQIEGFYYVDAPLMTAELSHQRSYTNHESIMIAVGAKQESFEEVAPVLEHIAAKVIYAGLPGKAQALKGATTIMLASQAQALCEVWGYLRTCHDISKNYCIDGERSNSNLDENLDTLALMAQDLGLMSFASVQLFDLLRGAHLNKGLYLRILMGDCFGALASLEDENASLPQFEAVLAPFRLILLAAPEEASCAALGFFYKDAKSAEQYGFNWTEAFEVLASLQDEEESISEDEM